MKPRMPRIYSYATPVEFKVVSLRECAFPSELLHCDRAENAVTYWRTHVMTADIYNPECECLVAIHLNSQLRIRGHQIVSIGTMDTILIHPREVFRAAIIGAAHSVVLIHNHPSGDPAPSAADIRVTRELVQAGKILHLDITDHIVVGGGKHASIRELGHFY